MPDFAKHSISIKLIQATLRQELQAYDITKITIQTDSSLEEHEEWCIGGEGDLKLHT